MHTLRLSLLLLLAFPLLLPAQYVPEGDSTGSYFGPAIPYRHNHIRSVSFWGGDLEGPILSWFTPPSTGPAFGLSDLGDSATSFEQKIGYGAAVWWRTRPGRTPGLRLGLDLGYRRINGRIYSRSRFFFENGVGAGELPEQHDFGLDLVRLGGRIEYELIAHPLLGRGPLVPSHAPIEEWWSLVLSVGLDGVWRPGSNLRMTGVFEENVGLRDLFPLEEDGRTWVMYDGPIPNLERFGAEFEAGLSFEFPLADLTFASVGLFYTRTLFPAAIDEWRYEGAGLRVGVGVE